MQSTRFLPRLPPAGRRLGDAYYAHAGLNEWADTNHLVVLYPQTIATGPNPEGCWDFWGYDSAGLREEDRPADGHGARDDRPLRGPDDDPTLPADGSSQERVRFEAARELHRPLAPRLGGALSWAKGKRSAQSASYLRGIAGSRERPPAGHASARGPFDWLRSLSRKPAPVIARNNETKPLVRLLLRFVEAITRT